MRRYGLWGGLAMAVALAAITAGGIVISQDDAPAAGDANVYVINTGAGSCTRSATPIDYATASSNGWTCGTLDAAFDAASAGDLVYVRCASGTSCTYSAGTISGDHGDPDVTIQAEPGYTIDVGTHTGPSTHPDNSGITANHITIKDITFSRWSAGGNDQTLDNVDADTWYVDGSNITVKNGDYGPYEPPCDGSSPRYDQPEASTTGGGILIKNNTFHDMTPDNCPGAHMDCLQIALANGTTIDGNTFTNCYSNAIILTGDFGIMDNIAIRNNFLGPTLAGNRALNWNATRNCPGSIVEYNTLYSGTTNSNAQIVCSTDSSTIIRGNIFNYLDSFECGGSALKGVKSYNLALSGSTTGCGTNAVIASGQLADPAGGNFHLIAGASESRDTGDPSNCPATDVDGDTRPVNLVCDRGADEYVSGGSAASPDLYLTTGGSDSNRCTSASPCLTIDRGYTLGKPGDYVAMAAGTYANQTVDTDSTKTSNTDVTVGPATGASVTIGNSSASANLTIDGADHLTVKGMAIDYWLIDDASSSTNDVTMENIDAKVIGIRQCTDCTVLNGDVGPYDTQDNAGVEDSQIGESGGPGGCGGPSGDGTTCTQDIVRLTFDSVDFHDITQVTFSGDPHVDCLQFLEGEDVTIRNSTFDDNCGEANDIYIRGDMGPVDGFTIENNFFYRTVDFFTIRLSGQSCPGGSSACTPPCRDTLIRNNTMRQRIGTDCNVLGFGTIRGNINLQSSSYHCNNGGGESWGIDSGWTYAYNVVGSADTECDASDVTGNPTFVSSTTDLHLSGGDGIADNVVPSPFAATDIDGVSRPVGAQADAGADER